VKYKAIIIIIVVVIVVGVLAIWFGPLLYDMYHDPFKGQRFNQQEWISAGEHGRAEDRGPMARDIQAHIIHKGMRRAEVQALLGKSNNSQVEAAKGDLDRYYLGLLGFMTMDGAYLIVHYDHRGRVTTTEVYAH
jgi:hypothetical protein